MENKGVIMKYYAPLSSKWNYWMISFENSHLNLVKLNIKTSFKFALSEQTGFYSNNIYDLISNDPNIDLREQTHFKLEYNETIKVKIKKNIFGEKLVFSSEKKSFNLSIQNNNIKDEIYSEFKNKLKGNFLF